jgi:hypothetical protein
MGVFFYSKAIVPETCFEISDNPGIELGQVQFRVRPEAVALVAVEAKTTKEARQKGGELVEKEMRVRAPK